VAQAVQKIRHSANLDIFCTRTRSYDAPARIINCMPRVVNRHDAGERKKKQDELHFCTLCLQGGQM
jgi:hypothetical protein